VTVEVEEEEVAEVASEEAEVVSTRTNGLHSPSSEDLSRPARSNHSKKFTLSPSQSRNTKSLIDLSPTSSTSSPTR
jgi:hypothetical protein